MQLKCLRIRDFDFRKVFNDIAVESAKIKVLTSYQGCEKLIAGPGRLKLTQGESASRLKAVAIYGVLR